MPLGCAATHNDGMVCERPVFVFWAWLCRAELCCKKRAKKAGRIEKKTERECESCEGGFPKGYVGAAPRNKIKYRWSGSSEPPETRGEG